MYSRILWIRTWVSLGEPLFCLPQREAGEYGVLRSHCYKEEKMIKHG